MKWPVLAVLLLMPAFMLGSSGAWAQVVPGNESDAVTESQPPALQRFSLSPWPSADRGQFGLTPPGAEAGNAGDELPTWFEPSVTYFDIDRDDQATNVGASTDGGVSSDGGSSTDGGHFVLPLLGDQARKAGYELPKPLGYGLIYTKIDRDVRVSDVRVGVGGGKLESVSDFVTLRARTHVDVALGRVDAWVLPFLDVYGVFGYVNNETRIRGTATLGRRGSIPIDVTTRIEGPTVGLGLTLAGGYKQAFATLDVNFSETNLGFDDNFRATIASLRTGWNGKVHGIPVRLWTGVTYWDTFATASGTAGTRLGSVRFEADQGPANPWNPVFGGLVTLHDNFDLLFELGTNFGDVQTLTVGLTYRF